jgi:hypothetical protein
MAAHRQRVLVAGGLNSFQVSKWNGSPDATPPRRRRRLVKTVAVFAWLMLYAVLCVILFIGALGFVGLLVLMLHR